MPPSFRKTGSPGGFSAAVQDSFDYMQGGKTAMDGSSDIIARSQPRYMVSSGACTKLVLASFTAGVIVGFTLNKSFRRLVRRLLKKLDH